MPQKKEMKNNISQSLDLESLLLLQEEEIFQTFTLQQLGLFPVLWSVNHHPPFSHRHTLEAKVPFSVVKKSVG